MVLVQSILWTLEVIVWILWLGNRFTQGLAWVIHVVLYMIGFGRR